MVASKIYRAKPKRKFRNKRLPFSRRQVKAVRRIATSTSESKYVDNSDSHSSMVASDNGLVGFIMPFSNDGLLNISQGDGVSNRDGNSVFIKGIKLKGILKAVSSGAHHLRIMLIRVPDQLETSNDDRYTDFNAMDVSSLYPRDTKPYKILWDKTYSIDSNNYPLQLINKYVKINKKVHYEDGTGSNVSRGQIALAFYTDNTTASAISLSLNSRTYFKDA